MLHRRQSPNLRVEANCSIMEVGGGFPDAGDLSPRVSTVNRRHDYKRKRGKQSLGNAQVGRIIQASHQDPFLIEANETVRVGNALGFEFDCSDHMLVQKLGGLEREDSNKN
ncbi:hypothetical protein HRI_003367900 [Hibiscus trionum]|uniref:Uncharacterized protein n=1 Tax=Hibiscus trionum TaxID=183268 RepID=A0A9W7IKX9_HIBTR|nr:hypothetical protein HRI_003367900 [Hibiscus trionum]